MKRVLSLILCAVLVMTALSCSFCCFAEGDIYLNDIMHTVTFERQQCYYGSICPSHGTIKIGNEDGTSATNYSHGFMYQSGATITGNGSSTTAFSFKVPSDYTAFTGVVGMCYGIDTNSGYNNRHRIRIFVNGAQKYISPLLKAKHGYGFNVPVKGGDTVTIEVYGAGSTTYGHVCFGDAKFTKQTYKQATVVFNKEVARPGDTLISNVQDSNSTDLPISYLWYVDDIYKSTASSYQLTENDVGKTVKCVAMDSSNAILGQKTMFITKLPQMCINTETGSDVENKTEYLGGQMRLYGNDKYKSTGDYWYNGEVELRGRGNSSWTFRKKSYKLKLDDKTAFFGMEKSKHWLLIAGCYDEAQMRNKVVYDFSGAMGMTYMQSEWVNLVLNGEDYGTYLLCEQVRVAKGRVDIKNWEGVAEDIADAVAEKNPEIDGGDLEDRLVEKLDWVTTGNFEFSGKNYTVSDYYSGSLSSITGGYVVQMEYDPAKNEPEDVSQFTSDYGLKFNLKEPEYVVTNASMYSYITNSIQNFENACLSDKFSTEIGGKTYKYYDIADMDSLVKNFLCNEIFYNPDAGYNSNYFYKDTNGKLIFAPVWDFDTSAAGKGGAGTEQYNLWQVDISRRNKNGLVVQSVWYRNLIKDPEFITAVYNAYWKYRDLLQSYVKNGGLYDEYYNYLKLDLSENSDLWYYKSGYEADFYAMKNWMINRLGWLDSQFASISNLYSSINGSQISGGLQISATDLSGDLVTSGGNIAYRQGLKLTVTAPDFPTRYISLSVNGKTIGKKEMDYIDYNASFTISPEYINAAVGSANIITVTGIDDECGNETLKSVFTVVRSTPVAGCSHPTAHRVTMSRKTATCTTAGYSGDVLCADCGKVFTAGKVLAKKAHTYTYYKQTKAPTYFSYGTKIATCNVCAYRGTITVPKLVLETPSSFSAYSVGYSSAKLKWKKVSGATGYMIYRKTTGSYKKIKTVVGGSVLSYTDKGLTTGKSYVYRIKAYVKISSGSYAYSRYTSGNSAKPLPAPPKLSVTAKSGTKSAYISWKKVSGATGYSVQMATKKGGKYKTVKTVTSGSTVKYTKRSLTKGKTYYFKIRAYKKVSGKKVYGNYSTAKYCKIK